MIVDYDKLINNVKGISIPKPLSGTLSGHAAGEPFDKLIYNEIKKEFPNKTFRQYEFLNDLYTKNPNAISFEDRKKLFPSGSIHFLLNRGKSATKKWSINNLFEEKQNDTADILVVNDDCYEIIDVKTRNLSKSSQPPNIISSFKLANLCNLLSKDEHLNNLTINYFEIDWKLVGNELVCHDSHFACLFKSNPRNLYINWAAAMQIQFHVCDLDQTFDGTIHDWAKLYLDYFIECVYKRSKYMINKFAKPFEE